MAQSFNNLEYQERVFTRLAKRISGKNHPRIMAAHALSKRAHEGQLRDEGMPYFIHPLRVANSLIEEFDVRDGDMICAALLHDVVEDTGMPLSAIKEMFGASIARLVKNLTRPRPKRETILHKKISKGRKYMATMRCDWPTRMIKCADMLDNMRCWPGRIAMRLSDNKFPRWFGEADRYYLPLARKTNKDAEEKMRAALDCALKTYHS